MYSITLLLCESFQQMSEIIWNSTVLGKGVSKLSADYQAAHGKETESHVLLANGSKERKIYQRIADSKFVAKYAKVAAP